MFTDELEEYGYNVYWKVLNAKNYGVPQNRERVYLIFIRKDVDNGTFQFPQPFDNGLRLKDLLDNDVDEKFYLSEEQTKRLTGNPFNQSNARVQDVGGECSTLLARDYKDPKCVQVGQIYPNSGNPQAGRVYDVDGISPTIDTCSGGNRMPKVLQGIDKSSNESREIDVANCIQAREDRGVSNRKGEGTAILVREATKKGNAEAEIGDSINFEQPNSKTRRGRVGKGVAQTLTTSTQQRVVIGAMRGRNPENPSDRTPGAPTEQRLEINESGCANTLTTVQKDNYVIIGSTQKNAVISNNGICPTLTEAMGMGGGQIPMHNYELRIRKLTTKECWRLMGFNDEEFARAESVCSNTQLYKQAGNSIVVDVLCYIYVELYKAMPYLFDDLKLCSLFSGIGAFEIALDRLHEGIQSGNFMNPQSH